MWATGFKKKFIALFETSAAWVRRWGGLRPAAPGGPSSAGDLAQAMDLVYDIERGVWVSELTYVYRSLECRLRVGEVEAPPALSRLRKAWRIDP
jgi:hypothetical protein